MKNKSSFLSQCSDCSCWREFLMTKEGDRDLKAVRLFVFIIIYLFFPNHNSIHFLSIPLVSKFFIQDHRKCPIYFCGLTNVKFSKGWRTIRGG